MKKTVKKYQKGGGIDDPKDPKSQTALKSPAQTLGAMSGKDYRQIKKGVKREQKLARIESGKQGERVDNVIRAVASGADAASSTLRAAQSAKDLMKNKKGGSVKKYQNGGPAISARAAERKSAKGKGFTSYSYGTKDAPGSEGNKGKYVPFTRAGRKDAKETGMVSSNEMKPARKIMKTGGMVKKTMTSKKK